MKPFLGGKKSNRLKTLVDTLVDLISPLSHFGHMSVSMDHRHAIFYYCFLQKHSNSEGICFAQHASGHPTESYLDSGLDSG